jgi:predicted RND superfamily exporter protein
MRTLEPRFNGRGILLIAIALALIGLAVLFRSGSTALASATGVPSSAAAGGLLHLFGALGVVVLLVVVAGLGACCGYIHLLRRFRNQLRAHEELSHKKT